MPDTNNFNLTMAISNPNSHQWDDPRRLSIATTSRSVYLDALEYLPVSSSADMIANPPSSPIRSEAANYQTHLPSHPRHRNGSVDSTGSFHDSGYESLSSPGSASSSMHASKSAATTEFTAFDTLHPKFSRARPSRRQRSSEHAQQLEAQQSRRDRPRPLSKNRPSTVSSSFLLSPLPTPASEYNQYLGTSITTTRAAVPNAERPASPLHNPVLAELPFSVLRPQHRATSSVPVLPLFNQSRPELSRQSRFQNTPRPSTSESLTPPQEPNYHPPPSTTYWTSTRTRRAEYATIDASSRGVLGLLNKFAPRLAPRSSRRHIAFDDDQGSVRRHRLDLDDEKEECEREDCEGEGAEDGETDGEGVYKQGAARRAMRNLISLKRRSSKLK